MNWSYSYSSDLWPALITLALTILLGSYSWRRRDVQGAKPFSVACLFAFLWTVGSNLEISATDFSSKVFWIKFQAVWQLPTMTALLCFVLEYAGFGSCLTRRNLSLLTILPLMTLLLVITNGYHNLVWTDFGLDDYVIQSFGSANWICVAYASILGLVIIAVLIWLAIRSPRHRWSRRRSKALL